MLRRIAGLTALALACAACGGEATSPPAAGTSTSSPTSSPVPSRTPSPSDERSPAAAPGTRIVTADSAYGPMLFDGTGQAIYLFDRERTKDPACYGACAEDWPPVLSRGEPVARGATRSGLLGTTVRRDGRRQVTYAGHPLYFYAHEGKDEVLCHDVTEYGGVWLVVRPDGRPAP